MARMASSLDPKPGELLPIAVVASKVHLFDSVNEQALY
jgi:hypothetical protein